MSDRIGNPWEMVIRLESSTLRLICMFVFVGYSALSFFLSKIIRISTISHVLLVVFCYIPFLIVLFRNGLKWTQLLMFFYIALSFLIYGIFNSTFVFESWAYPAAIRFFSGIIGYFIISIQDDGKKATELFKILIVILFAYNFIYSLNATEQASYQWGYDMSLGYRMLLPCVGALYFFLVPERKVLERLLWLSLVIGAVTVILSYGSRGPLLGIISMLMLRFLSLFSMKKKISLAKRLAIILVSLILIALFYLNFKNILLFVSEKLAEQGITSRTINRLIVGTISDDNGRNSIWSVAIARFNFLGHGPFSDQAYFGEGNFCHNFFIELFYDYGILIGTGLLVLMVVNFIRVVKNSAKTEWYGLFTIYLSYCLARLSFSGTFWTETNFWLLLGLGSLCIESTRQENSEKIENRNFNKMVIKK